MYKDGPYHAGKNIHSPSLWYVIKAGASNGSYEPAS